MNKMNSRDRVLAALNLEEPDRVPIGEIGYDLQSISSVLGIPINKGTTNRRRLIERSKDSQPFHRGSGLRCGSRKPSSPEGGYKIRKIDEWGAKYRYRDGISWYIGPGLDDPDDIKEMEPPDPDAPGMMDEPEILVERFRGKKALAGMIPSPKMPYLAR